MATELVTPSEIYGSSPLTKPDVCPVCGEHYQDGPERDRWALSNHCWRCGHVWGQEFDPTSKVTKINWAKMQALVSEAVNQAMNSPQQQAVEQYLRDHPDFIAQIATQNPVS